MEPIIGITANSTYVSDGGYPEPYKVNCSPRNLSKAISAAGGIPVVIPVNDPILIQRYAGIIDGLILSGGQDVSPVFYGEDPREKIGATYPKRDDSEVALAKAVIATEKPVLGICRGLQLLNVIHGGTLYQDLSENAEVFVKHRQETDTNHPIHKVKVDTTSYMGTFLSDEVSVNSLHHQIIRELGNGFKATATSNDGVIEAFESIDENMNVLAVQWHPENLYYKDDDHMALFEDLVIRAKNYAGVSLENKANQVI